MNQSTATAWDVFIAHAGADSAVAREMHDLLKKDDWAVFLDLVNLDYGDDWDRVLPEAQRRARITLVLVSKNTETAFYQRTEIAAAINMARQDDTAHRVVPVYLGPPGTYSIPYGLGLKHSIYECEMGGIAGVCQQISQMIARLKGAAADRIRKRDIAVDLSHGQANWDHFVDELDRRGLSDRLHTPRSLESPEALAGVSALILALPFQSEFTKAEVERLRSWVYGGGGLLLLGYYTAGAHHLNNINDLAGVFGVEFRQDVLLPHGLSDKNRRSHVYGESEYGVRVAIPQNEKHPLREGIDKLLIQSASSIDARASSTDTLQVVADEAEIWTPIGNKSGGYLRIIERYERAPDHSLPPTIIAARSYAKGRIVLVGSWKICTVDEANNRRFIDNALKWLAPELSIKQPK